MATEVLMPRQGQSVESCVILDWKKKEGEEVHKGETLCEVETDKAVFSVEAPQSGVVLKILYPEGTDVPVLKPIAYIGEKGERIPAGDTSGPIGADTQKELSRDTAGRAVDEARVQESREGTEQKEGKAYRISPRALKLAKEQGVALETVQGTGPKGRIIERDVRKAIEQKQKALHRIAEEAAILTVSQEGAGGSAGFEVTAPGQGKIPAGKQETSKVIPLGGTRKVIAQRMMESLSSHAQYTLHSSADARALLRIRKQFKESPESFGCRDITINDLILFAVARMLTRFPELNAYWLKDTIQQFSEVHLGMAVDTPRGLLVPVIRHAHSLSLLALSKEAKRLAEACMEGKVKAEELQGGTFTVTNLGNLGIQSFTPILNAPQVAILGVCSIQPQPVMEGEEVKFYPHIGLSLTVDHQAVDGAPASRFLKALVEGIGNIDLLLAGA
jgi:pyruvate dehydrogenase E2 component (dihydrolipoamide acetyltransferase)